MTYTDMIDDLENVIENIKEDVDHNEVDQLKDVRDALKKRLVNSEAPITAPNN